MSNAVNSKVITKALQQGQFIAQKGKILPRGYTRETSERLFKALTKDLKVPQKNALELMNSMTKVQESWATFLNTIFKGGNVNVGVKKFADLMNDRFQNVLSIEYKIFRREKCLHSCPNGW